MPRINNIPNAPTPQLADRVLGVVSGEAKNILLSVLQDLVATQVIDALNSTSTTSALSANQGRLLNDTLGLKLDASAHNDYYKGAYASLAALQSAHATSTSGSYALVDAGSGQDAQVYVWDTQDGWVLSGSSGSIANTDALAEGSSNLYFTEQRVRDTALTGLSLATGTAITASDSVLSALGKLQKQVSDGSSLDVRYSINAQTGTTYTVVAADVTAVGRVIVKCTNAAAITVSIPTPSNLGATTGDSFNIRQGSTGGLTLTGTGGATLEGSTTTTAQHETKTVIATSDTDWLVVGG